MRKIAENQLLQQWKHSAIAFLAASLLAGLMTAFIVEVTPKHSVSELELGNLSSSQYQQASHMLSDWLLLYDDREAEISCSSQSSDSYSDCILTYKTLGLTGEIDQRIDELLQLMDQLNTLDIRIIAGEFTDSPSAKDIPFWAIVVSTLSFIVTSLILYPPKKWIADLEKLPRLVFSNLWIFPAVLLIWFLISNLTFGLINFIPPNLLENWANFVNPFEGDQQVEILRSAINQALSVTTLIQGLILAPIFEEIVFRSWLYDRRARKYAFWIQASINSWFFCLFHAAVFGIGLVLGYSLNPIQASIGLFPTIFAISFFLFWLRKKFDSVLLCAVVHSFYNTVMFGLMVLILLRVN